MNDQDVYLRDEAPLKEALRELRISKRTNVTRDSEKKHRIILQHSRSEESINHEGRLRSGGNH